MKLIFSLKFMIVPVLIFMLGACAPAAAIGTVDPGKTAVPTSLPTVTPQPAPTSAPTPTLPPTPTSLPTPTPQPEHTFVPAIYEDAANGFKLDYPDGWTLIPNKQVGSRGSTAQLFSPGTTAEKLLEGGTRIGITVYLWDPKGDLAAYVTHRKTAWESGTSTIISESTDALADGRVQMSFTVQGPDKMKAFFMFTTLGENYLEIAGDGNLAVIEEIAKSMRPLDFKP